MNMKIEQKRGIMRKALIIGGGSGIGLALTINLIHKGYDKIYLVGKNAPDLNDVNSADRDEFIQKTTYEYLDLTNGLGDVFDRITDIDTLIITVGFGRVAPFEMLKEKEIENLVDVNMKSVIEVIRKYYNKISSSEPFYCAVMGSIAGHIASPLFSVYGASKAGLCAFIENINVELAHEKCPNRILDVSPGSLKGTKFNGGENNIGQLCELCDDIIRRMYNREVLHIPDYETTYKGVIERYRKDPMVFGVESYDYKIPRISNKSQITVGYLSGTFDLFHIGHLNLLRRAKEQCDYLIVGVHKSGAWKGKETFIPFEERADIIRNIKFVDMAVESCTEDVDAYHLYHYDKLFVGSDYKGTERFNRYEEYFKDRGVQIIYFPYTQGTSSTQLRDALSKK